MLSRGAQEFTSLAPIPPPLLPWGSWTLETPRQMPTGPEGVTSRFGDQNIQVLGISRAVWFGFKVGKVGPKGDKCESF